MFPIPPLLKHGIDPNLPGAINVSDSGLWPYTAQAGFVFRTTGRLQTNEHGSYVTSSGSWVPSLYYDAINPALYEVGVFSLTGDTGQLSGPAADAYHSADTEREWKIQTSLKDADYTVSGTVKIRLKSDPSSEATCPFTLTCQVPF